MATSVTDLVQQHSKVQQLIFPAAKSKIEVSALRQLIKYDPTNDSTAKAAEYFEKYLDELNNRGKLALKIFWQQLLLSKIWFVLGLAKVTAAVWSFAQN